MNPRLNDFLQEHMTKAGRSVPARLQSALALLEKLRDKPSLNLDEHLASKGSSGLESHETFGERAHKRLGIEPINKNHGRRSSNLKEWGQDLLNALKAVGLAEATSGKRGHLINCFQTELAKPLRDILEQEPLCARVDGRSAEAVIRDILKQAEDRRKGGDVAQHLVGAKLMLRFKHDIPVRLANERDRRSLLDRDARAGDFEIEDAVIEVAVGLPDDTHIAQVFKALEDIHAEVWLLTRSDRVATWKNELGNQGMEIRRVVITSVESFIGQNITELGEFSATRKTAQLKALFDIYNTRWVKRSRIPGIVIAVK